MLSELLGIDTAGTLVRIEANSLVYVLGQTDDDGLVEVSYGSGDRLRVFATDLLDRSTLLADHAARPGARRSSRSQPGNSRSRASGL
jgi:hypothetical protein